MKKLLFSATLGLFGFSAFAQLPVSTSVENKNVVLEEFTGIYCQYCPDGHLRAANLKAANPGDVVLINVHTGGYATPSGSDPDFRTAYGASLASQSGLTGYPSGTINRRVFSGSTTAQSRTLWATNGATVLAEPSYVNVALEGDINLSTNVLTVNVEMYFTGTTAPASVALNVGLVQNNVAGPQIGGSTYYPAQILPDGQYNHQHMLRELFTGQWGETITSTTNGSLVTRTYTYTMPRDINDVLIDPTNLELFAFVAEGQQDIITGSYGPVTLTAPVGTSIVNCAISEKTVLPSSFCDNTFTPEVELTNTSSVSVDSVEVSYSLNSGTSVSQWFTGTLAANGTTTVSFPQATLSTGNNTLTYQLSLNSVSSFADTIVSDNFTSSQTLSLLPSTANPVFDEEGFESFGNGGIPTDGIVIDETGRVFTVTQAIANLSNNIGGWASSATSLRFDFWGMPAGSVVSYVTEKYDFSTSTAAEVEFDYAYAQSGTVTGDEIAVYYSTDCGATWVEAWRKEGADLATATAVSAGLRFYPQASTEWTFAELQLPGINGESEVIFKIEGTTANSGSCFYFDNFNKSGSAIVSLDETSALSTLSLFPNPAHDVVNISLENKDVKTMEIEIFSVVGKKVFAQTFNNLQENVTINTKSFDNGVYIINVKANNEVKTQRVTVSH